MNEITRRRFFGVMGGTLAAVALAPLQRAWALVAPTLTGTVLSSTSVRLDWTDGGDETLYQVLRNSALLTTTAANVLTYTDATVSPATTYSYQVIAKKGGKRALSNIVQLTTSGGGVVTRTRAHTISAYVLGSGVTRQRTHTTDAYIFVAPSGVFPSYAEGYAA